MLLLMTEKSTLRGELGGITNAGGTLLGENSQALDCSLLFSMRSEIDANFVFSEPF